MVLGHVSDARLGGVGDGKSQFRLAEALRQLTPLSIGIEGAADGRDDPPRLDDLAVLHSAEQQRVQPILFVEGLGHALPNGLHHDGAAVQQAFFVEQVDHPVGEGPQEPALTELHDGFREDRQGAMNQPGRQTWGVLQETS